MLGPSHVVVPGRVRIVAAVVRHHLRGLRGAHGVHAQPQPSQRRVAGTGVDVGHGGARGDVAQRHEGVGDEHPPDLLPVHDIRRVDIRVLLADLLVVGRLVVVRSIGDLALLPVHGRCRDRHHEGRADDEGRHHQVGQHCRGRGSRRRRREAQADGAHRPQAHHEDEQVPRQRRPTRPARHGEDEQEGRRHGQERQGRQPCRHELADDDLAGAQRRRLQQGQGRVRPVPVDGGRRQGRGDDEADPQHEAERQVVQDRGDLALLSSRHPRQGGHASAQQHQDDAPHDQHDLPARRPHPLPQLQHRDRAHRLPAHRRSPSIAR